MLVVKSLSKAYKQTNKRIQALSDINFSIKKGEIVGIVGESGSGKSTLARILIHLEAADSGQIYFNDEDITYLTSNKLRQFYQQAQMIFQTPQNAFDPRQTLGNAVLEILLNNHWDKHLAKTRLAELFELVGLDIDLSKRYPNKVSGGQCQRVAIARALAINPQMLICDEITSALDSQTQDKIIKLLQKLQRKLNLTIIFISHDLSLIQNFCDKIIVIYAGKIVEQGDTKQVMQNPQNEYTKLLLQASL